MNEKYEKELRKLKAKMEAAEEFAKKIPILADKIIERKFTAEDRYISFGPSYKSLHLTWGINRSLFHSKYSPIHDYSVKENYELFLFHIRVNTVNLFDSLSDFDLLEFVKDVDIFYIDKTNLIFYVTDENIEAFLEALNIWYLVAVKKNKQEKLEAQIKKAKNELEKME